ncbi:hypothetical protein, partial [Klebsiella pneumoniae]|uniref:hypothetical protein n=1 Tax=Klebsiella pneumoniae TaxID=573 RepID=UPI001C0D71FF
RFKEIVESLERPEGEKNGNSKAEGEKFAELLRRFRFKEIVESLERPEGEKNGNSKADGTYRR